MSFLVSIRFCQRTDRDVWMQILFFPTSKLVLKAFKTQNSFSRHLYPTRFFDFPKMNLHLCHFWHKTKNALGHWCALGAKKEIVPFANRQRYLQPDIVLRRNDYRESQVIFLLDNPWNPNECPTTK